MIYRGARIVTSAFIRAALLAGASTAVLSAGVAAAQTIDAGVVSGEVVDAKSGDRLQGALVRIPSLNLRASTDREGKFRFGRVPAGQYELVITYQSKNAANQTINVTAGSNQTLAIELGDALYSEDEIVVHGSRPIADSEAAAYSRQRSSDKLINVVAADTIGRFPDQNVAAALSRLPGISVERDQGQERYVNLRGAPNKWTTISFNGLNVVSPEGRASRFDTIPNAVVSSIEATKAVTADMPAESIAGNIDLPPETSLVLM